MFKQIIVGKSNLHTEIDSIKIGLGIKYQFLSVHIGNINCAYQSGSLSTVSLNPRNGQELKQKWLANSLKKIFVRKYPRILKFAIIKIDHIDFFYKDKSNPISVIESLVFYKQKIVFELNNLTNQFTKCRVAIRIKPKKILYIVSTLDANGLACLQIPRLNGQIFFSASNQQITINAYAGKIHFNHKKIAIQVFNLVDLNISVIIDYSEDKIELNPDSTIMFNNMSLAMKGLFNHQEDLVSIVIYITAQVESLIHLIPKIQYNPLKDFSSEGQICVGLSLGFLWSDPLSYKFKLEYDVEDFKIINPGVNLFYLQNDFSFEGIINSEDNRALSVVELENDLGNTHLLSKIIQLSEDPNFYEHKGIDAYFVGVAIANNLALKRFFKGASTISMQLIKNLFLGEEKTVARKLEELILTLLLENYFCITKERILNIYLQIIELGPEIYGINEASKFYFNKTTAELNLMECLVISYIIPRPRFFLDALITKSEQLDRNLSKHIEGKLKMLLAKRKITKGDYLLIDKKVDFFACEALELTQLDLKDLENYFARFN